MYYVILRISSFVVVMSYVVCCRLLSFFLSIRSPFIYRHFSCFSFAVLLSCVFFRISYVYVRMSYVLCSCVFVFRSYFVFILA